MIIGFDEVHDMVRVFVELFFPTSLARPQDITTSLFDKLMISMFAEFTNISVPASGIT
jgi:hypothetical protein